MELLQVLGANLDGDGGDGQPDAHVEERDRQMGPPGIWVCVEMECD